MSKNKRNKSKHNAIKNEKYVQVYSKEQYIEDEKKFEDYSKNNKIDFNSFKRLLIRDVLNNTKVLSDGYIGGIKLEDAKKALENPIKLWKTVLQISEELMRISPHYYRMNMMYSNMAVFYWGTDLFGVKESAKKEEIKQNYNKLIEKLETMNIKHEMSKIMKYLPYQDIYCGLIFDNGTDFFIQRIDYNICKLYEIQDGIFNFIINLSAIKPQNLQAYPTYVQKAYLEYKDSNNLNACWYEPPADKQICLKFNSQWNYPYPILINLARDIIDLDLYKKLKLQSARTDNYKAISIKVPIDESHVDKPLLTPETLGIFAEINRESMTDDIGIIHTLGSDGKPISFKDSNNTRNNVSDAIDEIYNSSGVSKELFNGSSSGTAVTFSIENDSGFIYNLYRQIERWFNRYIKVKKYNKKLYKFHFYLVDATIFNKDDVQRRYKDAIALGVPVIDKYLASLDMTPARVLGSYVVHNDIFDYYNNFKPLQTSYNSSDNSQNNNGRPTNKSKGKKLDVSGEQTEDDDENKDR